MSRYSFPLLTACDIQQHLKSSLQLNFVSEDDITKPKSDTMKSIYTRLLSIADSTIDQDSFKLTEKDLEKLRYPDCHETSVPTIRLFKELNSLFNRIGCREEPFRLTDLINPELKRTRYYLSAIINFIKFSLEELSVKLENNEDAIRCRLLDAEIKKAEEEYMRVSNELASLNKFHAENLALVNQKNEQINEIESEKNRIIEERKRIEDRMSFLNLEIMKNEQSIQLLNAKIEDEINVSMNLKERIVNNPEELLKALEEKKGKYSELCNVKESERGLSEEARVKVEKMDKIVNKVKEVAVILETISVSKVKYEELCRTLENHKQQKLALERNVHEKKINIEHPDSATIQNIRHLESENKNLESRQISIEKALESKKSELEYVMKQNQELQQDLTEKNKIYEHLVQEKEELINSHEKTMHALSSEHKQMTDKAQSYSQKIISMLSKSEFFKNIKPSN